MKQIPNPLGAKLVDEGAFDACINVHQILRSPTQDSVIQCNGSLGIDHPPTYAEATDNPTSISCSN